MPRIKKSKEINTNPNKLRRTRPKSSLELSKMTSNKSEDLKSLHKNSSLIFPLPVMQKPNQFNDTIVI